MRRAFQSQGFSQGVGILVPWVPFMRGNMVELKCIVLRAGAASDMLDHREDSFGKQNISLGSNVLGHDLDGRKGIGGYQHGI